MSSAQVTQFPIEEEFKKHTDISPEDIAALRRWVDTQPHLPSKHITDLDLILNFHSCDCSTGVTKQILDLNYTLRTLFTTFFKDRKFEERISKILNSILLTPLPTRTKEGYAIFYMYFLESDARNFVHADMMRTVFMIVNLWQYKEGTWPGFILLVDYEQMSMGHLAKLEMQIIQQALYYMQEAMVVRLKGFHFMNAPSFIDKFMLMLKPFLNKRMMDMLVVYTTGSKDLESLIPMEALPKECGRKYKSLQEYKDDVIAMLQSGEEFFKNENLKRVTENLRTGKPKTLEDIFGGVEGSFKKLDID